MYEVSTFKNYFNQNNSGIDISYNKFLLKWWQAYYTTDIWYSSSKFNDPTIIRKKGFGISFYAQNTFRLNSNKTSYLAFTYYHSFPSRSGNGYSFQKGNLSISYKQLLLKKKLQLSLALKDILKQEKYRGEVYFNNNTQYYNNYYDNRKVTLSVTYNFGTLQSDNKNKQINFEEKDRAN